MEKNLPDNTAPVLSDDTAPVLPPTDQEPITVIEYDAKNREVKAVIDNGIITISKKETGVSKEFDIQNSFEAKEFFDHLVSCSQN
jgi:hypothetical protein